MSSQGDYDKERDSRRSPVVARGATRTPLDCDVRTSIGATAVPNITATAPSSPADLQSQRRALIKTYFISPTPPAGSTEQQAASSNTATRTLASVWGRCGWDMIRRIIGGWGGAGTYDWNSAE